MLLQISTSQLPGAPATDLGYLLAKNPAKVQTFDLSFGRAHAFYPVADENQCDFALLLEVDPIALVRGKNKNDSGPLAQYVNDRPYVAGSFASVAIAQVLRSALGGQSRERPELADCALPFSRARRCDSLRGRRQFRAQFVRAVGLPSCRTRHSPARSAVRLGRGAVRGVDVARARQTERFAGASVCFAAGFG